MATEQRIDSSSPLFIHSSDVRCEELSANTERNKGIRLKVVTSWLDIHLTSRENKNRGGIVPNQVIGDDVMSYTMPALTKEQYEQLLKMLNQPQTQAQQVEEDSPECSANFAVQGPSLKRPVEFVKSLR